MTNLAGMPHIAREPYVTAVLDVARRIGYPTVEVGSDVVPAGEAAWGAWVASAGRASLVRVLGILAARVHREGKA